MLALAALTITFAVRAVAADDVLLVPVDNRPAVGQFPQMIGAIGDANVVTPPERFLGEFLIPGSPENILAWLESEDLSRFGSLVVSTDMIGYGGLIASRAPGTSEAKAIARLKRLTAIKKRWPHLKLYGFSAVMRLAPTATRHTSSWRLTLSRYVEFMDRYRTEKTPELKKRIDALRKQIPDADLERYYQARRRNHLVQRQLVKMAKAGAFDFLLLGQDDAMPLGPHRLETESLKKLIKTVNAEHRVMFCEGIDQHAAVLVSRWMLARAGWTPRVRIVYSDQAAADKVAIYESKPLKYTLKEQIVASGALPAKNSVDYDYVLYVNAPGSREMYFKGFTQRLASELDQGMPVAVADVNLGKDGTCDPKLIEVLWRNNRIWKLLSFAGWNSAGNTMGTSVPAANVYLLARRGSMDPLQREIAQREFLLHRFVNDFAYHRFTRPIAYNLIDSRYNASREEVYGAAYHEVSDFIRRDLSKHLDQYFREQFLGQRFYAGARSYVISGLEDINISLPWPRAYEVSMQFRLRTQAASD